MLDRKQKLIKKIKSGRCIIDCHTHVGISFKSYVQSAFPYCLSFEDLILRMKYNSIDYSVVFPLDSTYYDVSEENPKNIQETERYSKFPYELENKNLLKEIFEIFPEYCGKVLPFLMFDPGRRTREQAALFEELSRKYPVFGLKTCTTYIQSYIKDLETTGRPILDFAINSRMPVIIHSSYDRGDPWAKIEDILEIAEKYPQLKICLAHSARFLKSALIKAAALKNCYIDLSAFYIHCLLAFQNHRAIPSLEERFEADYAHPESVMKKLVEEFPEKLIWGSDIPSNHFIQDWYDNKGKKVECRLKAGFDSEINLLNSLSEKERYSIAYENTSRFLFD